MITFAVLGPVVVRGGDGEIDIGEPRRRSVLGALLLEHGRTVRLDRLIALMWGHHPPVTARKAVQVYVSQLRRMLRPISGVCIETEQDGYLLRCPPESVDLAVFRSLVAEAKLETAPAPKRSLLSEAVSLWRGAAFAGAAEDGLLARVAHAIDEERLDALEDLFEAELRLGNDRRVLHDLQRLALEHPLRERLAGLCMVALSRSGRRAEAAEVFPRLRAALVAATGLEPGRALVALHRSILAGEAVMPPPAPSNREDSRRDLLDAIGRLSAANLTSLLDIGDNHLRDGDYDRALACYHAGRALARDVGDEAAVERASRGITHAGQAAGE